MSKQRPKVAKTETASATEVATLTTPIPSGTDPDSLPFPEWSDQDINLEKWDNSPAVKDKAAGVQQKIIFNDPQVVHLPPSVHVYEWKRCCEVFPDVTLSVFVSKPTYPDLITPNQHLLHSEFYRSFISSIETLLYIGCSKGFAEEYGSQAYNAPTDRAWRPWHHIYSNCKLVKGHSEHTPLYNPAGKYVVRLFWMGTWRKILVDDLIPLDENNTVLLPTLQIPQIKSETVENVILKPEKKKKSKSRSASPAKKEVLEIWSMILCKALLKIASFSISTKHELNDFDIIHCLTGWVPQKIKTKGIPTLDLWDIFMAYVDRFEWAELKEGSTKKSGSTKSKSKSKEKEKPEKSKKGSKFAPPIGIENVRSGDRFIVVTCDDFKTTQESKAFFQNRNIRVFISQIRNIPLIKPPPRPELELWKKFRYEDWAVEHGIIPPDIEKLNIKSLKIVDPFRKIFNLTQEIEQAEEKTQTTLETENTDRKSEKSSKSSKKTPKVKGPKHLLEPDPSIWIDFDELKELFNHLTIYFQPRIFKTKIKISDINFSNKTNDFKHIIFPHDLKQTRNEPIYMLVDSIDYQILLLNFEQVGNISMLEKKIEETPDSIHQSESLDEDMCIKIIMKKTEENTNINMSELSTKSLLMCHFNTRAANFVMEKYNWEINGFGQPIGMIQTVGTKSLLLNLVPGRSSFRLWVSSHCPYVLQVFSDTAINIGYLEEYLSAATAESQLTINLCYELSSCYGKLVQSFGLPDYPLCLRNFYHCYKPYEPLPKQELLIVHRALFEELCALVNQNCTFPNAVECFKLLFLQLNTFDYISPYVEEPHLSPDTFDTDSQVNYAKKMERAAVKIQAFFKGIYIRSLFEKMKENHKQYLVIFDTLKRIYTEIFSSEKRVSFCSTLLRRFFEREDMSELKKKFKVYEDLASVFQTHVIANSLNGHENAWILICRQDFFINSVPSLPVKINLFCNIKDYYVRVFNNQNEQEMNRLTNNTAVQMYESNAKGYTIICYGWTEEHAKINYKLVVATKKMAKSDSIIFPLSSAAVENFMGNYMPNCDGTICKFRLKISLDSLLTAHLTTSYDKVEIHLKLVDQDETVIQESYGVGSALLPAVQLQNKNDFVSESYAQLVPPKIHRKKLTSFSGTSDISYSKLCKKFGSLDITSVHSEVLSKKHSSTSDSRDGSYRRHKKKISMGSYDGDDEKSYNSHRSEHTHDSDLKSLGKVKSFVSSHSDADNISEKSKRSSARGRSLSNNKQRSSSRQSNLLNKVVETAPTEYFLEAIVVNNSWPLSAEEWSHTQQLKEQNYLNLLLERTISKKNSNPKKLSAPTSTIQKPYWILDLVHASDDLLEIQEDQSKSEMRKQTKIKWFQDVTRYKRGMEIRDAYLKENMQCKSDIENPKELRSNNPEDFALQIVKKPSFSEYMWKQPDDVDDDLCKTKQIEDYVAEEKCIDDTIQEFLKEEHVIKGELEDTLSNQTEKVETLSKWFEDVRSDSVQMINDALEMRRVYVKKALEITAKTKAGTKKGKKKK